MHMSAPEFDSATERLSPNEADPILANASMPLQHTYFPLGFPLSLVTNSHVTPCGSVSKLGKISPGVLNPALDAPYWSYR